MSFAKNAMGFSSIVAEKTKCLLRNFRTRAHNPGDGLCCKALRTNE